MITAELVHNPYLLETKVRFNGQKPRINSQIEKYEGSSLKSWAGNVPKIFYDEMNGYDFDLNFTGTVSDFMELGQAFERAGVSTDQVRLFHKNELEDVDTKCREIQTLLSWMQAHPNRKLDVQGFLAEHTELFEGVFPYIVIGGPQPENQDPHIRIEAVERAEHVQNTVLQNTPIVFCVDEEIGTFREDLSKILSRHDVHQRQLFFLIKATLNQAQVVRVLMDLGVKTPQVITGVYDEKVLKYLRDYPITSYIQTVINLLEETVEKLGEALICESEQSLQTNAAVRAEIDGYEEQIGRVKAVIMSFAERDNFSSRGAFQMARLTLESRIQKWRSWKTKIMGDEEAEEAAIEYDEELEEAWKDFIMNAQEVCSEIEIKIRALCHERYAEQEQDVQYIPENVVLEKSKEYEFHKMKSEFVKLKEIRYEGPRGDILDVLRKTVPKVPDRISTCYYEQWRSRATEKLLPIADQVIEDNIAVLQNYYGELAEAYHDHLMELLNAQIACKDQAMEKLSDEERWLQEDQDWLQTIRDQLVQIERG